MSASPAARRRAAELGIPLWSIAGSGPRGAIKLEDVDRAAELGIPLQSIAGSGPGGPIKLDDVDNLATPGHRNVTPVARKMAAAEGVDLDAIEATGPHDTVTKEDVRRATLALRSPSTSQPLTSQPLTSQNPLRDAIARAMAKSKREIPHYYLRSTFDVSDAMEWMTAYNAARPIGERLIFGALVAKATALAAHDVPEVNGFYDDGFRPIAPVHLGFAVAMRGGGVVAPAIHDLASRSLDDVMRAIKDLVARVRGGKLRSSEMTDATITLTSLGDQGVDTVFGVIYPPQVAIVGFGSPRDMPFARDGMIGIHTCADVTMSGDHRVSDGLTGARFLQRIDYHLSHPEQL